jgi:serine/threonine protein phosphatase PrpC
MGNQLTIEYAALTDVGRMRSANEDHLGHAELPWGQVFVVCDGMGGHVGGARASHIAVNSLLEYFARDLVVDPVVSLRKAVSFANEQIFATALNEPALKGMGTTCVILLQKETGLWLAHVGDSRIYIHSDGRLHKLTRDHSFVQGLVDQGVIAEEEAEEHPRKNELMRALGIGGEVDVEVTNEPIFPKQGDVFMLCSDGLNGMAGDRRMEELLSMNGSLGNKAQQLIDAANAAGGNDNITVQLVHILASPHLSNRFVAIKPPINMARTMPVQENIAPVLTDPRSPLQRYWLGIVLCGVVLLAGVLGLAGVFSSNGDVARDKAIADSLRNDSIQRVIAAEKADSTAKADSTMAAFKADSLHKDSVKRKLIPAKPR